jgi:hypothetical protein
MIGTDLHNYKRCRPTHHDTEMRGQKDIILVVVILGPQTRDFAKQVHYFTLTLSLCSTIQPSEPRQLWIHLLIYGLADRRAISVSKVAKLVNGQMCAQGKLISSTPLWYELRNILQSQYSSDYNLSDSTVTRLRADNLGSIQDRAMKFSLSCHVPTDTEAYLKDNGPFFSQEQGSVGLKLTIYLRLVPSLITLLFHTPS